MTACRNKASRAVTAALVGVLSVGAVPMVALAQTTAAPMASVDPDQAFSNGTVRLVAGSVAGATPSKGSYTIPSLTGALKPEVQSVKFNDVTISKKDLASNDYKIYYVKADADGNPGTETVSAITESGTYYVVVEAVSGAYEGGKASVKVTVEGLSLGSGVKAYEEGTAASTSYASEYDAEPVQLLFKKADGTKLVEGVDYTVRYFKSSEDYNGTGSETAPTDAGTYVARLTGAGAYAGSKAENVPFTIGKCDLNAATYYVADTTGTLPTAPTTVNGSAALAAQLKLEYGGAAGTVGDSRTYQPNVVTAKENDPNFQQKSVSGKVTFYKSDAPVSFTYDGESMPTEMTINLGNKESFKAGKVKATWSDEGKTKKVDPGTGDGQWSATVYNLDTKSNEASGLSKLSDAGNYLVTFRVNYAHPATNIKYGGSVQVKVTVTKGTVNAADSVIVKYDADAAGTDYSDVVVSSVERTYDGTTDLTDPGYFDVVVMNGKKPLREGTDYKVVFKDADGKETPSVKNAGEYTLEVVGLNGWVIEDGSIDITIDKADIQAIQVDPSMVKAINGKYSVAYKDGDPIKMAYEYTTGERDADGKLVWHDYASSALEAITTLTVTKDGEAVKQVVDKGDYVATLALLDTDEAKNYVLSADPLKFTVDESLTFVDVTPDMYYYGSVQKAFENHYIYGYNGGAVFGPTDSMSRADVAVVLYRMSAASISPNEEGAYTEMGGWNTGYEDVDGKAYYAEAVAWARKAGVVAGLDETHFGPDQKVTREQFATMLANYAKARGDFEAADESVLDKYGDSDQVSAFARGTMAWAVEEGVMGGSANLMPTNEVTRADVAVMAINYQPAPLAKPVA